MNRMTISMLFACLGVAACDATTGPAVGPAPLAEGLTIQAQSAEATRAAYREGERLVYIQTRKGEPLAAEYLAADPTLPAFGVDVRITDAQGEVIYARISGDGRDFAEDAPGAPWSDHTLDIPVARAGIAALSARTDASRAKGPLELAQARALTEVSDALVAGKATDGYEITYGPGEATSAPSEHDIVARPPPDPPTYKQHIEVWQKSCCVPGGHHSGTRMDSSANGTTWNNRVDFCNHGTCPGGSGMSYVCGFTSDWREGKSYAQMCSTGYGVTSTYSHNCNDDSHLEVIDVRHDWVYSTDDGSCHDFGANPDPDGCNPSTW